MFKNMNVLNLWTDRRAAVSVEFVLISIALIFFIFFLTDLVIRQATIGKLDRVSYSVAGILRERIQLYDARETLSQQDVDATAELAKKILTDMNSTIDLSQMSLHVEEMHFEDPIRLGDDRKQIKLYKTWDSGSAGQCTPPQPLNEQQQLTPRGSYGRWVPLYQVTVCLPTFSWFTRLTSTEETPLMSSFAIVMLR
ncbi:tight adherence pilus pseudopilin TadF [Obesumbacterium proteus]|uniref:TadF family Flp pilus assembly surface protein n=1 Tax=Obesumbacterium proteus ATCC 12841 TaxID=1354268 RepID=A0AA91IRQ0_9GAMM|nr:tight adherence pilus pseudopilin TadF [Obesumbacterium proteus]AMO81227.1 flp pilus assembly surface protein TadF [Obesumbacterium proteus]OAT60851.1 TadF family Flp pilus assembly surface protein [Obesumbacterium proteus ATCC 12841]TBL52637.1 flp pilus assembly surface protein TadF [Obesumbacterium proteus]